MKIKNLLLAPLLTLLFASCQKSIDWSKEAENNMNNTGGPTGELLVKVVAVTDGESITTTYTYDSEKRLVTEETKGTTDGMPINSYKKFYREANGRIFKVAQLIKETSIPVDTAFTMVYYPNASTLNFSHTIMEIGAAGFTTTDSTAYTYNSANNLTKSDSYMYSSFMGGAPILTTKWDYSYNNGNLVEQKAYSNITGSGNFDNILIIKYSYDSKTNPMIINGEFILTGRTEGASKNNMVKMELADIATPSNDHSITSTMIYGDGGKPTSATVVQNPGNVVSKYTFYYD